MQLIVEENYPLRRLSGATPHRRLFCWGNMRETLWLQGWAGGGRQSRADQENQIYFLTKVQP